MNAFVRKSLGASNQGGDPREEHDFYATDPEAVLLLLAQEQFAPKIWECACGQGHITRALVVYGYEVYSTDLINRGFCNDQLDFLQATEQFDGDIITNPPYKYALEFVLKALDLVPDKHKVAMFLKLSFLAGAKRKQLLFDAGKNPRTVYVFSKRQKCAKNGDFEHVGASAIDYAWFVWEKGYEGETTVKII